MIISLPTGDVLVKHVESKDIDEDNFYVHMVDLVRLVLPNYAPTVPGKVKERMEGILKVYKIEGQGRFKFIPASQAISFLDNIHINTRLNTMYVMQELSKSLKGLI